MSASASGSSSRVNPRISLWFRPGLRPNSAAIHHCVGRINSGLMCGLSNKTGREFVSCCSFDFVSEVRDLEHGSVIAFS